MRSAEQITVNDGAVALGTAEHAGVQSAPPTARLDLAWSRRLWTMTGAALVIGACAWGFIFRQEIATAIYVWSNSTAYNHCFLILPVACYLAWDRRWQLERTLPQPTPWIALLAIPVAASWFVADRLGIMEARQLMAMALFQIMVASALGLRRWRTLAMPLLYLFFLVPSGEELIPPLQKLAVHFTGSGLSLLGIPNFITGTTIEIPEGSFQVEETCAGLRFILAMAAISIPYVYLMYQRPLRRALFVILFLLAAIVGNCFRVLGTILLAHITGNAALVEAEHVYGGWAFYVVVGLVMMLIGLAFREERSAVPAATIPLPATGFTSRRFRFALASSVTLIIFFAAIPPVAAEYTNRLGTKVLYGGDPEMPDLPECTKVHLSVPIPALNEDDIGPSSSRSGAYRCGSDLFLLALYTYPARIGARPLFSLLRAAETPTGGNDIILQSRDAPSGDHDAPLWRITESGDSEGQYTAVATALWVNGRPTGTGISTRIDQALNTLRSAPRPPMIAVITHVARGAPFKASKTMAAFLPKTTQPLSEWGTK